MALKAQGGRFIPQRGGFSNTLQARNKVIASLNEAYVDALASGFPSEVVAQIKRAMDMAQRTQL